MKSRKYKKVNIHNTVGWSDDNEYQFGTYAFDKRAYDNMVLAVREMEANVDFADSKVDWNFATMCITVSKGAVQLTHFQSVKKTMKEEGNYTAQAFGYRWFLQNYAYENFTIWLIECFRQTFLLNNKKWDSSFGEHFNWMAD